MKIAFFGTPMFAGNILSGLCEYGDINVCCVVSQPDKPIGRKKEFQNTAVKSIAITHGIDVLQPHSLKSPQNFDHSMSSINKGGDETQLGGGIVGKLKSLDLDFIVVVAYGKIIPKNILDIPKYGCVNLHGSILPYYRGASPVQSAVKNGEIETGLTTMYMSEGMDEGDVLKIEKVQIDNVDKSQDIFTKFEKIGPNLLYTTLVEIMSRSITPVVQDKEQATYCGKIQKQDGEVSFQKQPAQEIYNTFRAYTPWPGIFSYFGEKKLSFEDVCVLSLSEKELVQGNVGEFIKISKGRYGIICADGGVLELLRVKPEGKKSMDIQSFVNGNTSIIGEKFT